jgi:hypothetical protein
MRITTHVTPAEKAEIQRRAKLHGMSVSKYLKQAALGTHTGPGADVERWWSNLSLTRKMQVWTWLTPARREEKPLGELLPFEDLAA